VTAAVQQQQSHRGGGWLVAVARLPNIIVPVGRRKSFGQRYHVSRQFEGI